MSRTPSKPISRRPALAAAALALGLALGALAHAESPPPPLSSPLALEQALALAEDHPRIQVSPALADQFPRRHPLYLDCHSLAFSAAAADPGRARPAAALLEPLVAQRLEVLERFLDVLLADFAFTRYDEALAVAYIQFDRASVRSELGQISRLRVMELESVYQEVLQNRAAAALGQQLTRALLAQALDRPETLPRDLLTPALPAIPDPLPALPELLAAAQTRNPAIERLSARAPEPDRRLVELELRQQIQEGLLRLGALAAAERQVRTEAAYRDLKLDDSRTRYEQETVADLGYSMSQQTMTRMQEARVAYCRALAWSELNALTGQPVWPDAEAAP